MNISMEEEQNIQDLSLEVATGITCIAGLMINVFIVTVNVTDWMKQRPVTTTDQIITSLGISKMIFQSICLLDIFCPIFLQLAIIYSIISDFIQTISFYVCVWLSALLSVVFCLKISNFHNVFYLRLKNIILQRIVHLIIASLLVSICYTSIEFLITRFEIDKNSTEVTYSKDISELHSFMFLLGNMVPFLVVFTSTVLLIFSLCQHMNRMRYDRSVTRHLDNYYKIIQFLIFSFFSYTIYFVSIATMFYHGSFDIIVMYFMLNVFPTLHSICLIYVTTKLRNRLCGILQHGTNCLLNRQRSIPNSEDQLETITQRPN